VNAPAVGSLVRNFSEDMNVNNGLKIAFIGPGVMAEAMIAGLIRQAIVPEESIVV
jgi:hypothetical protein